jgi:GTP-binding protein
MTGMNITSTEFVKGIRGTDEILADGIPNIAFIGRSNVGKSSILNSLTKEKGMARVGVKPGKTTEINFFLINKTHYFVDLPGYGYAAGAHGDREKLRKLIIWYFTSGEVRPHKVDLILEAKAGLTKFDEQMIAVLKEQKHPYIIVLNKVDKLSQKELSQQVANITQVAGAVDIVQTSTKTGRGIDALRKEIWK